MPFQVSPGVAVREIDLTTIVPAVSTTEGAIAGVFRWGPIDQAILVDSETALVNRFGKPTNFNSETFFTAASFLGYGNRLYVSRAANTAGASPAVTVNTTANSTSVTLSTGNTSSLAVGYIVISSSNGGLTNGATIASIVNSTAFTITSSADATATATDSSIQFVSNTVFSAVANTGAVANLEYAIIKNEDHFIAKGNTFDSDVKFIARYPGELGNSLKVSICGNQQGYSSQINLASYGARTEMTVESNANSAVLSIAATSNTAAGANATAFKTKIQVTDNIEVGNTLIGTQLMKITAIGNTTVYGNTAVTIDITTNTEDSNNVVTANNTTSLFSGMVLTTATDDKLLSLVVNNIINSTAFATTTTPTVNVAANSATFSPAAKFTISFEDPYSLAEDYTFSSANTSTRMLQRYWEHVNLVDTAPGQSDYVINFGNSAINADELHIVVSDDGGKITGVPGTVLEVYRALSRATDSKTIDGAANYWREVINDASQYVWAVNDVSGAASNTADNLANSTLDVVSLNFNLGRDGQDEANIPLGLLTSAYDKFASAEDIDISLVLQGRARSFQLANYLIDNIAEKRKDCVVFASPQKADVVNNIGNEASAIVAFRNNLRSTSYGVMDSGYKYMYDRYNDVYRWVPLNGDTAGLCVRTDETNDPWWSPAGFNRGQIKNLVKLAYNPRKADRDTLYKAGVNPVVTFPGQGTVLFGDKTLLAKPSAFDRINVRRLFIVLEKAISTASKFTLFEFNDGFTRSQFKNLVIPYLRDVQGRRGIYDFLVVCDESNNTPEVIDRNEFVGDIYIKPARSINFIQLNFIAVRTGVAFNEVVGKF